jgi:hypothetical protein
VNLPSNAISETLFLVDGNSLCRSFSVRFSFFPGNAIWKSWEKQTRLFHYVNSILQESYSGHIWNSLNTEKKWQVISDPQNEFQKQLIENVLRLEVEALRFERDRKSAHSRPEI